MSWVPDFEHDVFLSYARVDNSTVDGDAERRGWVAQFHQHLSVALSKKVGDLHSVAIWRDVRQIDGSQLFDRTIEDAVRRSAVFVALTSTGYLHSDYCRKELQSFFRNAQQEPSGLALGDRYRIFNVRLNQVARSAWPAEFARAEGFQFYEGDDPDVDGDTADPASERFRAQLQSLAKAIYRTLCRLKEGDEATAAPRADDSDRALVYIAETSDTVGEIRARIVKELGKAEGVTLAARVPPPLEADAHDAAAQVALKAADLSVHVLDANPGHDVIDAEGTYYPQRQMELALAHGRSQLILMPPDVTRDAVRNPSYAAFLDHLENGPRGQQSTYHVQRELPSAMSRQILTAIEQIKARRTSPLETPAAATLLDTHIKDQLHAFELGQYLMKRKVATLINPQEDDPGQNIELFTQRLKRVGILVIFYGSVPWDWVRERLRIALQIAVAEMCPLRACAVYMAPPLKPGATQSFSLPLVSLEWMDHTQGFNAMAVDRLLARVQGHGGSP